MCAKSLNNIDSHPKNKTKLKVFTTVHVAQGSLKQPCKLRELRVALCRNLNQTLVKHNPPPSSQSAA